MIKVKVAAATESEDPQARMIQQMMAGVDIKNGKSEGTMTLSRKDGQIVEQTVKTTMHMTMKGPGGAPPMEIDTVGTMTMTRLDR